MNPGWKGLLFLFLVACASCRLDSGETDEVRLLQSFVVEEGQTLEGEVVCILCSAEIRGTVHGEVVVVGGNASVRGQIAGGVVALVEAWRKRIPASPNQGVQGCRTRWISAPSRRV